MPQNKLSLKHPICPRCKSRRMVPWTPNHKGGKPRWACVKVEGSRHGGGQTREFCLITTDPFRAPRDRTGRAVKPTVFRRPLGKMRRVIITAAQNATPLHLPFWEALQVAAKHLDAEILVIPLRYLNRNSKYVEGEDDEWWAEAVKPFLYNARRRLNENLMLMADIKTVPTASSPLTGFEAIAGAESCIIGHTKLQMKTVAVLGHKLPKILTTTGACTIVNYTDSKVGKVGEFHHTLGAVIVELEDKVFHLRHVSAERSGAFTDLGTHYDANGARPAAAPLALIMGDTHVDSIDPAVERATFGLGGIVETLNPGTLVWHDLLDAYAVNGHHLGDPFIAFAKEQSGKNDAAAEVKRAIDFLVKRSVGRRSVVVSSNHDDMLRRWINRSDWRSDPTNAEFYLKTALAMLHGTEMTPAGTKYPSPFKYWIDERGAGNIDVLADQSFQLGGVELSLHGDIGPNGARGSRMNLRRIGTKSIIGHSHSPGIEEGCYQVGTSSYLSLEYNHGPSSWLNTHCILHANGKRQLINIIDGHWRMDDGSGVSKRVLPRNSEGD